MLKEYYPEMKTRWNFGVGPVFGFYKIATGGSGTGPGSRKLLARVQVRVLGSKIFDSGFGSGPGSSFYHCIVHSNTLTTWN
jgi:hypothetical protein